ncbi:MAG: nitroreductase family protein [Candidatus Bipolaricaulota bacterium]
MEVKEAILKRRSVRSYKERKVRREKLEKIMESVRMAPSASNRQDWKFVLTDDPEKRERLYEVARRQSFVREAPVVIAGVSTDPENYMSCEVEAGTVDLSIALDHLALRAAEEGLGTCWIGAFDQDEAKKILNIPDRYKVIALMTLGYPKKPLKKKDKPRKVLEEIISYNSLED